MLTLQKYRNKKIAIYGMGITGISAAKILKKLGAKIFCWDDNLKIRKKIENSEFDLVKIWKEKNRFDNIVISPGIDINKCKIKNYLKKNINKIITDLDIFFEINKNIPIISITGTNGKSTTCKIIEKILKTANFDVSTAGNIGKPILSLKKVKKNFIVILEVSSYQLQYSRLFRSKYAAILNISPDHLERHKSIKNYIKVKSKIFFSQKKSDYSYINLNNKYSKKIKKLFRSKKLKSKLIHVNNLNHKKLIKKINNKHFKSKGSIENLIFAYKISKRFKISDKVIIKAINRFKGLAHRQEVVLSNKKVLCINDSKATSFDACYQSLSNYNKIYWILGGIPKYKDHFYLEKVKKNIKKAYIIGNNALFFKKKIRKKIPFEISVSMKNAVNSILKDLKLSNNSKSTILLSPAGASFDQFSNFESRGNFFKNLVIKKFKKK